MNLIELQPDDVLVLRCPGRMSKDQRDAALVGMRGYLGADRKVIFLDAGETLDVVRVGLTGKVETNEIVTRADFVADHHARIAQGVGDMVRAAEDQREVQHIDTPETEPAGIPPHVFLYKNMCTDLQRLAPLGIDDTNGQYAVAIDQLTDEQRAIPHVSRQLDEQNNDM